MIFVHGGSGSGSQFESQAMRFESNLYPHEYIKVLEYDSQSLYNFSTQQVNMALLEQTWANLDQLIASTEAETGADQVDILGHSLGTMVMQGYINSSAERAAKLAHYVNIDGQTGDGASGHGSRRAGADPGAVGRQGSPFSQRAEHGAAGDSGRDERRHPGPDARPDRHVAGVVRRDVQVLHRRRAADQRTSCLSRGRLSLPEGRSSSRRTRESAGASLEIWKVNRKTGVRIGSRPEAIYAIGADGNWGPFGAISGQAYEFNIVRAGQSDHPFYYEPFIRSDYLIRLNTSPEPGGGISGTMDRSPNHVNLVVTRNMEFWGDQGAENDVLAINGVNVISAATHPISKLINAMFLFDKGSDRVSHLGVPVQPYASITFFTGIDDLRPGHALLRTRRASCRSSLRHAWAAA